MARRGTHAIGTRAGYARQRALGASSEKLATARKTVKELVGGVSEAREALARFADGDSPEVAKQALERAGAPILAWNVLEAASPGEPCRECGRKRLGARWANLLLAKVLRWVQPAVEVNLYLQGMVQELGFETVEEMKRAAVAARDATAVPEDDPAAAYRMCLEFCNEHRRRNGMADLIEPERAVEA